MSIEAFNLIITIVCGTIIGVVAYRVMQDYIDKEWKKNRHD